MTFYKIIVAKGKSASCQSTYTANVYIQITFTLLYKLARNTNSICKCQVRWNVSKKYADLGQKLLRDKGSLLALQDELRNHGT